MSARILALAIAVVLMLTVACTVVSDQKNVTVYAVPTGVAGFIGAGTSGDPKRKRDQAPDKPVGGQTKIPVFARDAADVLSKQDATQDPEVLAAEITERYAEHRDINRAVQSVAIAHGLVSHGEISYRNTVRGGESRIRWDSSGLYLVHISYDKKGEEVRSEIQVLAGCIRPQRRVQVEEDLYVQIGILDGQTVTDTVPGIRSRLDRMGRVLSHNDAIDVLPNWLHNLLPKTEMAYPTWGFYADRDGRIIEARDPVPVRPEQEGAWSEVSGALDYPIDAESLQAYVDLFGFVHPREYLPILGSSVAGPFAYLIRCEREMFCHPYSYSRNPGLGKTTISEACSIDM
ncbi:MAG: hypothetical protein L3J92_05095 [Thermoplasmata archaeon]|nr:hypothetical protein [Thermoplasmata archaeon]